MFKPADKFEQEVFCFPVWGQISNLSPESMQVKHHSPVWGQISNLSPESMQVKHHSPASVDEYL